MRLLCAFVLTALLWALPMTIGHGGASALAAMVQPALAQTLLHDAKIVCGQTDQGFKCRNEFGGIRRGKMRNIPGASSGGTSKAPMDAGEAPASNEAGNTPPSATPANCPRNTELLGGACVHYTASCRSGVAANANVPPCQNTEEKLVCKMGSDGLRHCCCQLYNKH